MIRKNKVVIALAAAATFAAVSACSGGGGGGGGGGDDIPFEECLLLMATSVNADTEHRYVAFAPTEQWTSGQIDFGSGASDAFGQILYNLYFAPGATTGETQSVWIATNGSVTVEADPFAMDEEADIELAGGSDYIFVEGTQFNATMTGGAGEASVAFSEIDDCLGPDASAEDCNIGAGEVTFTRDSSGSVSTVNIGGDLTILVCDVPTDDFAPESRREWAERMARTRFPR